MSDTDFCWRAEMACRAAWPADEEVAVAGLALRRSGGTIRRTNSANALRGAPALDDTTIDRIEEFYRGHGQGPRIRLMSIDGLAADLLEARGYEANGHTLTLHAGLDERHDGLGEEASKSSGPTDAWLAARDRIAVSDGSTFRRMLSLVESETLFSASFEEGEIVSIAYGVIHDGLLVIESVATQAHSRGRGLGKRTVGALMRWARENGVRSAVLQVVGSNEPALALYRSLGFDRQLFDYRYLALAA